MGILHKLFAGSLFWKITNKTYSFVSIALTNCFPLPFPMYLATLEISLVVILQLPFYSSPQPRKIRNLILPMSSSSS